MRQKILVVDDEPTVRKAMARELRLEFDISLAASPLDALALLDEGGDFCAVVSDLMMSGPTGIELLEEVRRRAPACARVLVSGSVVDSEIPAVLRSGAVQEVVCKPWQRGELLAAVRGLVGERPRET